MMKYFYLALGATVFAGHTAAFPTLAEEYAKLATRIASGGKRQAASPGFNAAAQRIDVSGTHAFVPPGSGDQRGPCPGLNALANHNYLPHNGVGTTQQFIQATNQVYGMGLDLATFLATYGAVMDGDLVSWSIGGPPGSSAIPGGVLGQPQGISGSHNKYETDGSPTRGDLYQYGNNFLVQLPQFEEMYNLQAGVPNDQSNYDLPLLTKFRSSRFEQSINNNPYFFYGPFSGVAVQPAAYTFIFRFMGNKSAERPEGQLTKEVLKSFFAISGTEGNFTYTAGHERIPENWYKRAPGDEYTIPFYQSDLNAAALRHPKFLIPGGNTGETNTYTPVDIANLTGGVYNARNLLQGNNLACFAFQAGAQATPDILKGPVNAAQAAATRARANALLAPLLDRLGCPRLQDIDKSQFEKYPGYKNCPDGCSRY